MEIYYNLVNFDQRSCRYGHCEKYDWYMVFVLVYFATPLCLSKARTWIFIDMYMLLLFSWHVVNFQTFFHNSLLVSCQPISFVLSFRFSLSRVNYKILSNIDMDWVVQSSIKCKCQLKSNWLLNWLEMYMKFNCT